MDSGNVITFRLQGIMQQGSASDPVSSQGFINFRTGLLTGLPHGSSVSNTPGSYVVQITMPKGDRAMIRFVVE